MSAVVGAPCLLDSIETVSDVGGRALGTLMLFHSPDIHSHRQIPGSFARLPTQVTNSR